MGEMFRSTLVIFTPSRGVVDIKWAWHMHHVFPSLIPPVMTHHFVIADRCSILDSFNAMADAAVANRIKYLAIIEDDVFPPPGSVGRLIRRLQENPDHGIACGVYFMKRDGDGSYPLVFREWEMGPDWTWNPGDIILDAAAGAQGLCVIDVEKVLAKMTKPRFRWDWTYTRDDGEEVVWGRSADLYLFYACKREAGMKILIDCGILAEHHCRARNKFFPTHPEIRQRYGYPMEGPHANPGDLERDSRGLTDEFTKLGIEGTCDTCGEEVIGGRCSRCGP